MANENEIEKYLVDKITLAIGRLGKQQNLLTKLYSFKDEFTPLLNNLSSTTYPNIKDDRQSVRRNNLYSLNNLVTEWHVIIKNQNALSAIEIYESCENIKKSLRKMKKELSGEESSSRGDPDVSRTPHHQPNHPVFKRNRNDVYRWSSRHAPRKVHGLEHHILAMERDLVTRNTNAAFKVFGVVGAPGIGKTTLCQAVFGLNSVKERFCPRVWVCLSKQPRDRSDYREEIVVRMLKCLGVEDEVINNVGKDHVYGLKRLILLLRLQLSANRYLIVLDDAWNEDENDVKKFFANLNQREQMDENWGEELAYGLPKGSGGTVVASSSSEALLKMMLGKDVDLQYLQPQTDEIIYDIFRDAVIGYGDDEREFAQHLEDLKGEWLKKCDGIPLAAKLLANIAREPLKLKPKPEPQQPPTGATGIHEIEQVLAGISGVEDGGHTVGFLLKAKHKNALPPVGPDQMA